MATKSLVILSVLALVVGGSALGSAYLLGGQVSQTSQSINQLQAKHVTVDKGVSDLQGKLDAIGKQISDMQAKLDTTSKQVSDLQAKESQQVSEIQAKSDAVSKQVSDLLAKSDALSKQVSALQTSVAPKTQKLKIQMAEGTIIEPYKPENRKATGDVFYRWEPDTLVVRKGDTVELTVTNPRRTAHSLVIEGGCKVNTGLIPGREEQPDAAKRTVTVKCVADEAGVFLYHCGTSYDGASLKCTPDHGAQVGYLIVLDM